jgi:hypothetical protein
MTAFAHPLFRWQPSNLFVVVELGVGMPDARAYSKRRLDCGWRLENRHSQQLHGAIILT